MQYLDNLRTLIFKSGSDGTDRELLLSIPLDFKKGAKYPLVISPHPFGWSHFENFTSGAADLLQPFKGWSGLSEKYKVIIALPLGHGRIYEKISLGRDSQVQDLVAIPDVLDMMKIKINMERIYITGLSMGGMETLTTLGRYPDFFRAGFSFNGICDLAAWYDDIKNRAGVDQKLIDMEIDKLVVDEVGGTPSECPDEYKKRSSVNYISSLVKTNLMLYWSSKESIVVNNEQHQSKRLYNLIKAEDPNSQVYEHDHSYEHGFSDFTPEERIRCHEYSDFDLAMKWLLEY
jgi:predicted peptidase